MVHEIFFFSAPFELQGLGGENKILVFQECDSLESGVAMFPSFEGPRVVARCREECRW